MTEIKADLLDTHIRLQYYQDQMVNPKDMAKGQAEESVATWTTRVITLEKRLEGYKKFDLKKLKRYDI